MLVSKIKEEDLTPEVMDRLLFQGLDDTGESADCILVLGSVKAAKYRVPVAVDVYNAGRAPKIMLCGGALRDFPDGRCSEAEHMRRAVLELDVPEEDIIRENSSQNTVENILFALIELQRAFWLNKVHKGCWSQQLTICGAVWRSRAICSRSILKFFLALRMTPLQGGTTG
ncbi:MAG: YdcF family protein [Clostridia bacterium]|nr:YdcF family protein [Clostridia bacterium]